MYFYYVPWIEEASLSNLDAVEEWSSSLAQIGYMKLVNMQTAKPMPMLESLSPANFIILSARTPDTTTKLNVSMNIITP